MGSLIHNVRTIITDDKGTTDVVSETVERTFTAKEDKQFVIPASGTATIWNPTIDSTEAVSAFTFLRMDSDRDLKVEETVNEGDASEEMNSFTLAAKTAYVLGSNAAYSNHSPSDSFAGTLDVIDKVRVTNLDGSNAANLRVLMVS